MVPFRVTGKPRNIRIVCPRDGGRLVWDEAGLTCPKCGNSWERDGDVPVFAPEADRSLPRSPAASTDDGRPDAFQSGPDWRFLIPLGPETRVLVLGFQNEDVVDAIAPDVNTVGTVETEVERAEILGEPGTDFENVVPVVSSAGIVPFADGTFDVALVDPDLLPASRERRRARLALLGRKLTASGTLFLPVENRWGCFFPGPARREGGSRGLLGMDGWRRLLRSAGFPKADFHAAFPDARCPRELVPLDDPAPFSWWWDRAHEHDGAPGHRLGKLANHLGLLARLAPSYAIVAGKGGDE